LHAAALNLLTQLRCATTNNPTPPSLGIADPFPAEARSDRTRKCFFNRRRQYDPFGEGQPDTWHSRLIQVADEIAASFRQTTFSP
jgi:hypothetical protein